MSQPSLSDPAFDQPVELRVAYRLMEAFLTQTLSQGDRPLSEVLHAYLGIAANGESADPAALKEYLAEATAFLTRKVY